MNRKQLQEKYPSKEFGSINVHRDRIDYDNSGLVDPGWQFFLNHSCDEWIIGDLEKTLKFQKDLAEAIEYAKNNP